MIKIEKVDVFGWESAIRGMRNPMNSWDKSDSNWEIMNEDDYELGYDPNIEFVIGENDLKLMKTLSKAGSDHGKFLRMINVTFDVTAPLYFFKEFDTYKVGTVANSCSTMHKIHAKEFTMDDFSHEHLLDDDNGDNVDDCDWIPVMDDDYYEEWDGIEFLKATIKALNWYRNRYLKTKNKLYWWQMIQLLPSSYNQKRTVQLNYQVLKTMYFARVNHKLDEWREFCKWCETLPYFKEICLDD